MLGNHFNNHVCNKKRTDERCSLIRLTGTNVQNDDLSLSVSKSYKWEDLSDRSLVSEESLSRFEYRDSVSNESSRESRSSLGVRR